MGEYEGAIHLGDLYLQDEEIKNRTEGIRYLELAVEKTDRPYPKLLMVSTYLDDETILQDFKTCKRIYKLMKDINEVGEINAWYYHGYKKYTMGRFDQALQLFSFASMNGHKQATLAAAYIWEHNLTETLT